MKKILIALPLVLALTSHANDRCVGNSAQVFTVVAATNACGAPVRNSYVIGALRRNLFPCRHNERVIAQVFASPRTCDDCGSRSAVRSLRQQRWEDYCRVPEYIDALIEDLAASAAGIRIAAQRSLRACGLQVVSSYQCVDAPVPSIARY